MHAIRSTGSLHLGLHSTAVSLAREPIPSLTSKIQLQVSKHWKQRLDIARATCQPSLGGLGFFCVISEKELISPGLSVSWMDIKLTFIADWDCGIMQICTLCLFVRVDQPSYSSSLLDLCEEFYLFLPLPSPWLSQLVIASAPPHVYIFSEIKSSGKFIHPPQKGHYALQCSFWFSPVLFLCKSYVRAVSWKIHKGNNFQLKGTGLIFLHGAALECSMETFK